MFRRTCLSATRMAMKDSSSLQRSTTKAGYVKNPEGYERFTTFDAAQVSRRQHQLATMGDQLLREAHHHLMLSLQEIPWKLPMYATLLGSPPVTSLPLESTSDTSSDSMLQPESRHTTSPVHDKLPPQTIGGPPKSENEKTLGFELWSAIENKNVELAIDLFEQTQQSNKKISQETLIRLFKLVVEEDPITAYLALKSHCADNSESLTLPQITMYRKLCLSLAYLRPRQYNQDYLENFLRSLMQDLASFERNEKQELLPNFIIGTATQRLVTIGLYAREAYRYMVENDYVFNSDWLRQLLALSKYNRQDDLPFHDILERLAAQNGRPHPLTTIQAIHNMFPFTDTKNMCIALKAFLDIHTTMMPGDFPRPMTPDETLIDIECLELISAGAARASDPELVVLVWEVLEHCNYSATEAIYESTVVTFASSKNGLQAAFRAINAMKNEGFEVSRSLLRSFSLAIRYDKDLLDHGKKILIHAGELRSLETVNALMSCYAERGDVPEVIHLFEIMQLNNLHPDINSYSFAIEVLGKNIHRRPEYSTPAMVEQNIDHADQILSMMEADGIFPSRDLIRNYVMLLCEAGEWDTANKVVDNMLANAPDSVCNKTLYKVAMVNAQRNNFDRAKYLASQITDDIPILFDMIRQCEERNRRESRKREARVQL